MAVPGAAAANAAHIAVGTASVSTRRAELAFPHITCELVYATILSYRKILVVPLPLLIRVRVRLYSSSHVICGKATQRHTFACYMWECHTTAPTVPYMHMHTAGSVKQESCIVVCAAQANTQRVTREGDTSQHANAVSGLRNTHPERNGRPRQHQSFGVHLSCRQSLPGCANA